MELRWTAISLLRLPDCSFFSSSYFFSLSSPISTCSRWRLLCCLFFMSAVPLMQIALLWTFLSSTQCTKSLWLLTCFHFTLCRILLVNGPYVRQWKKKTTYLSLTHGKNGCKNTKDDWLSVHRGDWIYTLTRFFDGLIKKALMSSLFDLVNFWVKTATTLWVFVCFHVVMLIII